MIEGPRRTTPADACPYCDRVCDRCGYEIPGGWEHLEQVQPPGGSHFVCSYRRHVAPLVTVVDEYLTHAERHIPKRQPTPTIRVTPNEEYL